MERLYLEIPDGINPQTGKEYKYANEFSEQSDNINSFTSCTMVIPKGWIIIDIDDTISHDDLKGILDYLNIAPEYRVTKRGFHIYFKKPKNYRKAIANAVCQIGLAVEYKDCNNTPNGITVKRDGVEREVFNRGNEVELPKHFYPTKASMQDHLYGLGDGEGRNNQLFAFKRHISKDIVQSVAYIINNFIFSEPMSIDKLEHTMRTTDDKYKTNGKVDIIKVSQDVMVQLKTVVYDKMLFFKYNNTHYIHDYDLMEREIKVLHPYLLSTQVTEVVKQCRLMSELIDVTSFPINIKNGHLIDGEFIPIQYSEFTPFYIDVEYKPNAQPVEAVEQLINHITNNDPEYRQYLMEMTAYPLIYDLEFKSHMASFFILVGNGSNGKGTLLKYLKHIYGKRNSTDMSIDQLTDRTMLASGKNKLINCGDDIEDIPIKESHMKILKNISTADSFTTRDLYEKSVSTHMGLTLMFTSNHILKSFEKGNSYKRRVHWLPVFGEVKNKDKKFFTKLFTQEATEYMFKLMVEAMMTLYERAEFIIPTEVKKFTEDYHKFNNNVLQYIDEIEEVDYLYMKPKEVYDSYKAWCEHEMGFKPLQKKTFDSTRNGRN